MPARPKMRAGGEANPTGAPMRDDAEQCGQRDEDE